MRTQPQHDLARRLILAAIKADAATPLCGTIDRRTGWIRWRANPRSVPHLPAVEMSDAGKVKFLRSLAMTIGVDAFVRLCDDLARQCGRQTLTAFLDEQTPGWRNGRAA